MLLRSVDAAVVLVTMYLAVVVKAELGEKAQYLMCQLLLALIVLFLAIELFIGALYALNFRSSVADMEIARRTWVWMKGFDLHINLVACALLSAAVAVYHVVRRCPHGCQPTASPINRFPPPSARQPVARDGTSPSLLLAWARLG